MSLDPFKAFIDLVNLDQTVEKNRTLLVSTKNQVVELTTTLSVQKKAIQVLVDAVHTQKKYADSIQLELRTIDDRLAKVRVSLSSAQNPKEYFSLESEQAQLSAKQSALEELLFSLLTELDQSSQNLLGEQGRHDLALQSIHKEMERLLQIIKNLEISIRISLEAIEALKPYVQSEVLERFIQMKKRAIDPVVPVIDGACSACSNVVLAQALSNLARRTLSECRNCFRLLYLPEAV